MTLEERLSLIETKIKKDEEKKKMQENKRIQQSIESVNKIKSLQDRIEALLIVINKCIELKVEIPDKYKTTYYGYGNNTVTFCADGFYHKVGFMGKINPVKYIGFYNGGACGPWDFYTNGIETFNKHERTQEIREASLQDMKYFLNEFDIFEHAFYNWIDSMND